MRPPLIAFGLLRDPFTPQHIRLQPPSLSPPLDAEGLGRDVLARIAHSALSTIGLALIVTLMSVLGVSLASLVRR